MANVSDAATMTAAGPPYNRNVRKIRASAKLMANFDRGRARLIRGARITANPKTKANPQLNTPIVRLAAANEIENIPARITVPLAVSYARFLSIEGKFAV